MKPVFSILLFNILLLSFPATSIAQEVHGICGFPLMNDSLAEAGWKNTLTRYPGIAEAVALWRLRKGEEALRVGSQELFWTYNFERSNFDTVRAELIASGFSSHIWVALSELSNGRIRVADAGAILQLLDQKSPPSSRDSTKGILSLVRQFFGNPPNVNAQFVKGGGDGRTHFLIYDIKDGAKPGGVYVKGYFHRVDVDPTSTSTLYSNRRDLLYIDSYPGIMGFDGRRDIMNSVDVLAHEFQHLVHWNYDPSEIKFFNEGLSEYAQVISGYGLRNPSGYYKNTNVALLDWNDNISDYERAGLWTYYLSIQFGDQFIRALTQHPKSGIEGFDAAAVQSGLSQRFHRVVENFFIANAVNDKRINPAYGYSDMTTGGYVGWYRDYLGAAGSGNRSNLQPLGVDYIRFRLADSINVSFLSSSGDLKIKALQKTDQGMVVHDVGSPGSYVGLFTGSSVSELMLVMYSAKTAGSMSYSFASAGKGRAKGIFEYAHDDGKTLFPSNTMLRNNDTVFVVFPGIRGARIDSIRIWFETRGNVTLMIRDANSTYEFLLQPMGGLGQKQRIPGSPIAVTVVDTSWFGTSVDVRSHNVSAHPDFVVQVIYGSGAPNPLLRRDIGQINVRSYLSLSDLAGSGRVMYMSTGDFYLRAYLTPSDSVERDPLNIPDRFVLYQNFPNPFNQSTSIMYEVLEETPVTLTVYDLLGREIAVLVNTTQLPYVYEATFRPEGLSSGIYLYRLTAGNYTSTKKMLYLK